MTPPDVNSSLEFLTHGLKLYIYIYIYIIYMYYNIMYVKKSLSATLCLDVDIGTLYYRPIEAGDLPSLLSSSRNSMVKID